MASTYTANSGIEKIGAGEQAGAQGTTTNNNFDIIDKAINGVEAMKLSKLAYLYASVAESGPQASEKRSENEKGVPDNAADKVATDLKARMRIFLDLL